MHPFGFVSLLLILFIIGITQPVMFGQDNRMSEDDIKVEDRFVQANLLAANGKRKEAILLLDTIRRELAQPNASVFLALAKLYYAQKDLNGCETNLIQAIKTDPTNVWALEFGFDYYKSTGRFDDALVTIDKIIALEPQKAVWYDRKASWLESIGKRTEAVGALNQKDLQFGYSTASSLKKIELMQKNGQVDEALAELEKILRAYPQEKKYLELGAALLHEAGRVSESRPYLEKILALDPSDADARTGLALLNQTSMTDSQYLEALMPIISDGQVNIDKKIKELVPLMEKQTAEADTQLHQDLEVLAKELCRIHPTEAKAFALYGDVLKNAGNVDMAIVQYQNTLALSKRNFMVWEQLMFCLEKTGDFSALAKTATEVIDYFPNQAIAYIFLASAQLSTGAVKEAKANLEEAGIIASGSKDLESRIQRVWGKWAFTSKDVNKAGEFAEISLQLSNGQNGDAWELKGDISAAKGNLSEAKQYWEKAYKLGGWNKKLAEKLNLKK